jgi:predicted nucleic acid-binding protein
MELAFWDSSSVVPVCIQQPASISLKELTIDYGMVVSWFAAVEIRGSFARLLRMSQITPNDQVQALVFLDELRSEWREVRPTEALRQRAEGFVEHFPLRSADALQLASAWEWCQGHPRNRPFISGDAKLLEAAFLLGFKIIES